MLRHFSTLAITISGFFIALSDNLFATPQSSHSETRELVSSFDDSLIVHFDFNSDFTSGTLKDLSKFGNNATCQIGFFVDNKLDGTYVDVNQCPKITGGIGASSAADFSGSVCRLNSSYFGVASSALFENMTSGTISLWIKYNPKEDPNYLVPMFGFGNQHVIDTRKMGRLYTWMLNKEYSSKTHFILEGQGVPIKLLVFPDENATKVWNHYGITWDADTAKAYYNGTLVQTTSKSHIPYFTQSEYIAIGAMKHNTYRNQRTLNCGGRPGTLGQYDAALQYYYDNNYPGYSAADGWKNFNDMSDNKPFVMPNHGFLNGQLDDLRIYSRALSEGEISALARANSNSSVLITISRRGTGAGNITDNQGNIQCGSTCLANYQIGDSLTLTATPAAGSKFDGWDLPGQTCSGSSQCTTTITTNQVIGAVFTSLNSAPDAPNNLRLAE